MNPSMTTTAFELPGYRVVKTFGVVRGIIVRSRSIFGTIGGYAGSRVFSLRPSAVKILSGLEIGLLIGGITACVASHQPDVEHEQRDVEADEDAEADPEPRRAHCRGVRGTRFEQSLHDPRLPADLGQAPAEGRSCGDGQIDS